MAEVLRFEWNARKAVLNRKKHGVSFEEARTVFDDPLARIFADEGSSAGELREIVVGASILGRLVLVSFIENPENHVRIISAREATRREAKDFEDAQ